VESNMGAYTKTSAGCNSPRSFNSGVPIFETLFAKDMDSVKNHRLENLGHIFFIM
jgi:hypothetical protein